MRLPAILLLSTAAAAQSPWTPSQHYIDPAHGVSFSYPAGWRRTHRAQSMDGPSLMSSSAISAKAVFYSQRLYPGTNLEAVYFAYAVKRLPDADECTALLRDLTIQDDSKPIPPITVNGVQFAAGEGGDASAGHSSWGRVYATYRYGNCYLFETNTAAVSSGLLDHARDLTHRDFDMIDRHLAALLLTVRLKRP